MSSIPTWIKLFAVMSTLEGSASLEHGEEDEGVVRCVHEGG
jgi:hypothetical protein